MASFSQNDPDCVSVVVFVGNVQLKDFHESDPRFSADPATAELVIDVIAAPGFLFVPFVDITLDLEIQKPAGALFVEHGTRKGYHRQVPSGADFKDSGDPTSKLRIRVDRDNLLSGPLNGLTLSAGVVGVSDPGALEITALACASEVRPSTCSCKMTITDMHAGELLSGYLPPLR